MIKGHGNDILNCECPLVADFSSCVCSEGMPKGLMNYLQKEMSIIIHYPSPDAAPLATKIAHFHHLDNDNVLVTNGSTEAFYLLAQLFSKYDSYIPYPSFSEYEDACRIFNHHIHFIKNDQHFLDSRFNSNSLFWLGNPNNPDGKITSAKEILDLCEKNPNTFFIVDEAYGDLCDGFHSVLQYIQDFDNLIVIKSLTKTFSIPGLRLGYVLASEKIINKLLKIKMPWSVNSLAIEAGNFIMDNYSSLLPNKELIIKDSQFLQQELAKMPELIVTASNVNYFLCSIKKGKASDLNQFLITEFGFLIRNASNFRGLTESHFRIATQQPQFNALLIKAIQQWIKDKNVCI
jgi:threonine-phosphate decarboxylase